MGVKSNALKEDIDLLDQSTTVRLKKSEIKDRVIWITAKEVCQVCEVSKELDYPHHAIFGWSKKDDRTMINICLDCHRNIHTKGYEGMIKTREEIEQIGWSNNEEFLNEKRRTEIS